VLHILSVKFLEFFCFEDWLGTLVHVYCIEATGVDDFLENIQSVVSLLCQEVGPQDAMQFSSGIVIVICH